MDHELQINMSDSDEDLFETGSPLLQPRHGSQTKAEGPSGAAALSSAHTGLVGTSIHAPLT